MSNPGNMTYDESDYMRMGKTRHSSFKNELLIKPKLGTVKRHTRDIPDSEFRHGIMNAYGETVQDAMVHQGHVPNPHATRGKDIRAMNKAAPRMNVTRTDEQRPYREEHPLKLKVKRRLANVAPLPSELNPDYVYGKPLPRWLGETVEDVITYSYADEWIKMNQHHQHDYQISEPLSVPPKSTKTVAVRSDSCYQKYKPPPPKDRFVMSRFRKVGHKIDNVQTTPLMRDDRPGVFDRPGVGARGGPPSENTMALLLARQPPRPVPGPQQRGVDATASVPLIFRRNYNDNAANLAGPRRSDPSEVGSPLMPPPLKVGGPRRSDPD